MKNYNWKKGVVFLFGCMLFGFIVGILLVMLGKSANLQEIVTTIESLLPSLFGIAFISGLIGLGGYFYFDRKLKKENYLDEEGSFYEKYEKIISITLMCSTLAAVLNFTALGLTLLQETPLVALFLVNVFLAFFGEVGHISLIKKVRPELNADPLNIKFSKNYFEQLDECEKNKTGKACFQTLASLVPLYVGLFMICYILSIQFEVSPIICLPIGIIWAAQTILLTYYTNKKTN